jgi:serine/threonine protein kinase
MASVWAALQHGKHGFEKVVAIKTTLPEFAGDQRFRRMFLDEARIASRIDHPNVARIVDLGEEDGILFIAMEYIDGDSLSSLNRACQQRGMRLAPGVLLRILADTCAGLHEAHELDDSAAAPLGIVHCDVSPDNILVDAKGVAKLIDFGIAKIRPRLGQDSDSAIKGKPRYMAPEQALGMPLNRQADVWSVGAILYRLLAGKSHQDLPRQLCFADGVHPAITAIAGKALSYAPEQRHATAAEMREALEHVMRESDLVTTTEDVAAFCRRHLVERAEKRRRALASALAFSSDRRSHQDNGPPSAIIALRRVRVPPAALPTVEGSPEPATPTGTIPGRRSYRPLLLAVALAVLAMGIATGVALRRQVAGKHPVLMGEVPKAENDFGFPRATPASAVAATGGPPVESETLSNVPVVPASALPRANVAAKASTPVGKPSLPKRPQIIDDGF